VVFDVPEKFTRILSLTECPVCRRIKNNYLYSSSFGAVLQYEQRFHIVPNLLSDSKNCIGIAFLIVAHDVHLSVIILLGIIFHVNFTEDKLTVFSALCRYLP